MIKILINNRNLNNNSMMKIITNNNVKIIKFFKVIKTKTIQNMKKIKKKIKTFSHLMKIEQLKLNIQNKLVLLKIHIMMILTKKIQIKMKKKKILNYLINKIDKYFTIHFQNQLTLLKLNRNYNNNIINKLILTSIIKQIVKLYLFI